MGYSHYWQQHKTFSKKEWDLLVKSCKILFENLPPTTNSAGGHHYDSPLQIGGILGKRSEKNGIVLNEGEIGFNGKGDPPGLKEGISPWEIGGTEYWEFACESFLISRVRPRKHKWQTKENRGMSSCKTNRKPYDLVVCSVLLLAHAVAPEKLEYQEAEDSVPYAKNLLFSISQKLSEEMQKLMVLDSFRP